jgi:hypothetical protein
VTQKPSPMNSYQIKDMTCNTRKTISRAGYTDLDNTNEIVVELKWIWLTQN